MDGRTFQDLIRFWRDIEALSLQSVPKPGHEDQGPDQRTREWRAVTRAPWLDETFLKSPIPATKMWRHTVYVALFGRDRFISLLEDAIGPRPDVHEERQGGEGCVFSLGVDELGQPMVETLTLSTAAWGVGVVLRTGTPGSLADPAACRLEGLHALPPVQRRPLPSSTGLVGFDRQLDALREELAWRLANRSEPTPLDWGWFADFVALVVDRLGLAILFADAEPTHRVLSVQVRRPKPGVTDDGTLRAADDDLLNSFFITDLNRILAGGRAAAGPGLGRYLAPPDGLDRAGQGRLDVVQDREQALACLEPKRFPRGCWPARHPLVWSQQLGVNALWRALATEGVFAINGPPGTGKTTLLRDVVAAVVVERAMALVDPAAGPRGERLFGERRTVTIGDKEVSYFALAEALCGRAIVVASSNNGAVENLSLELPGEKNIDPDWIGQSNAFPELASQLLRAPAWALIAGRLGRKSNREAFVNGLWWGQPAKDKDSSAAPVPGLRDILADRRGAPDETDHVWEAACQRFHQAADDEARWRRQIDRWAGAGRTLARERQARDALAVELAEAAATADQATTRLSGHLTEAARLRDDVNELERRLSTITAQRPGWLTCVATLGRSHREWSRDQGACRRQWIAADDAARMHERRSASLEADRGRTADHRAAVAARLDTLDKTIATSARLADEARSALGASFPDLGASVADQECTSPWSHPEWHRARIRLFLAALDLHRAFVEANAGKVAANLRLATDMLTKSLPDPEARAMALDSLALVCPVVSTTFASVATMFGAMKPGSIGWLLIDEAGQAAPQQAAGAIWRARRTVVVGDPLQLEPIVTVPRVVQASLAAHHALTDPGWLPSRSSVQRLADRANPVGTWLEDDEGPFWVGAPLRVHRRCDEPMFSIANEIAYRGLMVLQKPPSSVDWPASHWIDVPASRPQGNWLPADGVALKGLLTELIRHHGVPPEDLFLISPFRDVVNQLRVIGRSLGLPPKKIGTVHTTQGKEAAVVVIVLGGGTPGARSWMTEKPNLLNVAVSRAKTRLYVIGDREAWAWRPHVRVLDRELDRRQDDPHRNDLSAARMDDGHA